MLMAVGPRAASEVLIKKSYVGVGSSDLIRSASISSHPHEKIIGRLLTVSTGTPHVSFLALQERVEQGDAEAGEDVVALRRGRLVAEDVAELGDLLGEAVS